MCGWSISSAIAVSFVRGRAGLGYHSYFATPANAIGGRFDNFRMAPISTSRVDDWLWNN